MEDALASLDRTNFSCTVPVFVPHPEAEVGRTLARDTRVLQRRAQTHACTVLLCRVSGKVLFGGRLRVHVGQRPTRCDGEYTRRGLFIV